MQEQDQKEKKNNSQFELIRNRFEQILDNAADRSVTLGRLSRNPPPKHTFLIGSDSRFADILDKLRMNNNILLVDQALNRPRSIIWYWKELVFHPCVELLPGRSWYLIYNGICEDPFTISDQHKYKSPTIEEDSSNAELYLYCSLRPVPNVLLRHLGDILDCVPGGLTITELHNELEARKVSIDEVSLYGYQKFLHLLLALPYIVDVQSRPDGQLIVRHAYFAIQQSLSYDDDYDYDYENRRVSRAVMAEVDSIVRYRKKGVSMTDFKNQLEVSNVVVDYEGFYGYGTLERFLLALPHVVVESPLVEDGEIFVRSSPTTVGIFYSGPPMGRNVDCGSICVTRRLSAEEIFRDGQISCDAEGFVDEEEARLYTNYFLGRL